MRRSAQWRRVFRSKMNPYLLKMRAGKIPNEINGVFGGPACNASSFTDGKIEAAKVPNGIKPLRRR
jgi:hypothetical protein